MAKKKEPPKPYYPLAHEYMASLENLLAAGSALYRSVSLLRNHLDGKVPIEILKMIDDELVAYQRAHSEE